MVAQGATPQPSPTVQPHPHTKCHQPTTAHTQGSHKATKPQQSEAPTTMLLPSHTHTGSGPTRQPHQKAHGDGDGGKRGATPQARGQPWLITRGVLPCHNPLTSGPHTHAHTRDSGRRCGGKHGVDETTHTPHHEHHALKPKWQAHTMPSQWLSQSMVHCALACVCGQATCCTRTHAHTHGQVEGPQKPSSQHSSHHQQPPHQHPSNKPHGGHSHRLVTHTHTRGKQDKGHSKTKAVVAMACTVTMPWHKRATPVVMPPWLVHQVHAPPMQVATSTHTHSATHTQEGEKRGVGRGATRSGEAQWRERDCATVPPTLPTSVHTTHCAPCQSTTWSTIHHPPTTSE